MKLSKNKKMEFVIISKEYDDGYDAYIVKTYVNGAIRRIAVREDGDVAVIDDEDNPVAYAVEAVAEALGVTAKEVMTICKIINGTGIIGKWEEEGFPLYPQTYGMVELERNLEYVAERMAACSMEIEHGHFDNLEKNEEGYLTCPEIEKLNKELDELQCKSDGLIVALGHAYAVALRYTVYTDAINDVNSWFTRIFVQHEHEIFAKRRNRE